MVGSQLVLHRLMESKLSASNTSSFLELLDEEDRAKFLKFVAASSSLSKGSSLPPGVKLRSQISNVVKGCGQHLGSQT